MTERKPDTRKGDRHKFRPVNFRPATEEDRAWLEAETARTGQSARAILAEALTDLRAKREREAQAPPPAKTSDPSS